ncbi:hypothetical protein IWW36_000558 [Coemansia brasiliensis]|uniref:Uncharacterized protein n=1 Tax=Coemansia brasiliensis TaxID=2650707 RepID=A0A9W8M1R8_9FUNG|nr:hypothetical protein IWW36_000558 [Coemansia brasiliensis]
MECSNALVGLGEPVSTAEAAAIRVLVVPVGRVRAERFWSWTRELTRSGSMGAVRLEFVARTGEHEHLEGLQTHRQVLGVVGLVDGAICSDITDSSAVFAAEVAGHATAVASQCLAYDADADAVAAAEGVTAIATPDDIRIAADELAGALVSALNVMAATLEEQDEGDDSSATARRGAELERERVEAQQGGGSGRLHKLRGDVLLMAGRATEALGEYTKAIEASELVGDRLWQAAAAEGYCAALVQLAARDPEAAGVYIIGMPGADIQLSSNSDMAAVAAGIAEVHELVPKMMQLCHAVAPILVAEASIRAAQAVQAARAAGEGKAEQALRALAQGKTIRCAVGERRSAVAEWAGRAWDCVDGLDLPEQLRIAAAAGTVTSAAGLRRRAVFYLRQFVLRAVPLLMRAGRAEHAAQTAFADGAAAFAAVNAQAATSVAGHGLPPVLLQQPGNGRLHGPALPDGLRSAVMACVDALERKVGQWPSLRADVLRACMAAAAVLPSPAHAAAAAVQLASCLQRNSLVLQRRALADEQHILRGFLQRTAAQLAPEQTAELSAALSGLLVSIHHVELTAHARPERTAKAASVAADSLFLHNPSTATAIKLATATTVAGECAWFVVTLCNPLPFALVLSDMRLLGAQDPGVLCTVPTGSVSRVLLPLTPQVPAEQLVIRGISARVFQHAEIQCTLADGDTDAGRRLRKRQLQQRLDAERRSLVSNNTTVDILSPVDEGCALNVTVTPGLPYLSVVSSSNSQLPLSLFEGETYVVDLVLANSGIASADWLNVSFEPSEGDAERREVVDAATLFCLQGADAGVDPCGTCTLSIRVDGIPGLQNVCVVVRYGTNQAPEWSRVLRWTLQVSVSPLLVPVTAAAGNALPVQFYDLPPYMERALGTQTQIESDVLRALRDAAQSRKLAADQFCLAEISVSNAGASDLQLLIEVDLGSDRTYTLKSKIPAHASLARVTLPLLRVQLSADEQNAPVPGIEADGGADISLFYPWRSSLLPSAADDVKWQRGKSVDHGRQFVIPRQTNSTSVKMQRVFYWTKQALVERVRIRWTCMQSQRTGFVDPRTLLQLDQRQLAVVRPRLLQMHMFVDGNEPVRAGQQLLQAQCQTRHPTQLVIKLNNQSLHALNPLVSVQVVGHPLVPHIAPVDAWAHRPGYKERLAAAAVSLPNTSQRKQSPRFRFKQPAVTMDPVKSELNTGDLLPESKQAELTSGIVLDNISQLLLPEIPATGTSELALPLYVSVPGRYHIDIAINDKCHSSNLVQETLMINS